jgi:hypothetical protein
MRKRESVRQASARRVHSARRGDVGPGGADLRRHRPDRDGRDAAPAPRSSRRSAPARCSSSSPRWSAR